jgi:RNA polymerase sigma-70 factor (ECF subfamily)
MTFRIRNERTHTRRRMPGDRERILDELLVLRCREGSRAAFGLLVERWQERLWRHAHRLTGRTDVAWDVLQEAWISITKGLAGLDDPARFGPWAYTIVTRRAADWGRRDGPDEAAVPLADEREPSAPVPEPSDDVDALRTALARLPGEQRALLSLHYVDGFDVAAIAEILAVPEGTVKSRLHTAREHLRGRIDPHGTIERNVK